MQIHRVESPTEGYQPPLSGDALAMDEELALKRKRGLLLRILSTQRDGALYMVIERVEASFKANGTRENMFFYKTKDGTEKTVLATPEDLRWVIATRRNTVLASKIKQ